MTARRRPGVLARTLGLVCLTVPLAATVTLGTAPPAFAASDGLIAPTPTQDQAISSGSSVSARGELARPTATSPATKSVVLTFTGPGNYHSNTAWSCAFSSSSSPCDSPPLTAELSPGGTARANGKWSAVLCWGTTDCSNSRNSIFDSRTFYTNLPPTATPSGLTAQSTSPAPGATSGTVALSWSYAGTEPDKAGFLVDDGKGGTSTVGAGVCSGGSCSTTVTRDNPTPGTYDYSFTVTALRTSGGCSSCGDTVAGTESSAATAQLVTPPPPSPTPAPGGSPSPGATRSPAPGKGTGAGGSSSGGKGTGGHAGSGGAKGSPIIVPTLNPVIAARKSFALSFNSFSPSLGIPKLPPLPATTFPETVAGSQDSYQATLPYKAASPPPTTSVLASPLAEVVGGLDTEQLARSLAFALLLLVTAAHVRLFLSGHRPD